MFTIRKEFKFEMAHRLVSSFHKPCQRPHGHSYVLELFFTSNELNEDGMVIDFAQVKDIIGEYVDSWDHIMVLKASDPLVDVLLGENIDKNIKAADGIKVVNYNPTAENMARDMYQYIKSVLPQLSKVRLHETTTGWAEYYE